MSKRTPQSTCYWPSKLLLGGLTLCLLLLSACSTSADNGNGNTTTVTPTPTVNTTVKSQASTQLQAYQQWISLLKQYGGDTTKYQQQYDTDQQSFQSAKTTADYQTVLNTLNGQVEAIKIPALKTEVQNLQAQLQTQVSDFGKQHTYHDTYNNTTYALGYEYGLTGSGGLEQDDMNKAKTVADYQQAVEDIQIYLFNFQAMKTNTADKTPYNQSHKTDMDLLKRYNVTDQHVLVVSLQEQAMRVYDNSKLVKSMLVTTGRPNHPTLAGSWWVEGKQSPTTFKAGVPKDNPDWYPDTPIHYAMQYHSNGYFIHDSWWRVSYGPGTNYPHQDDSGDPFSSQGSHGCVNISQNDAAWVYGFVKLYTSIIIY